jgi:hypothetical protein
METCSALYLLRYCIAGGPTTLTLYLKLKLKLKLNARRNIAPRQSVSVKHQLTRLARMNTPRSPSEVYPTEFGGL